MEVKAVTAAGVVMWVFVAGTVGATAGMLALAALGVFLWGEASPILHSSLPTDARFQTHWPEVAWGDAAVKAGAALRFIFLETEANQALAGSLKEVPFSAPTAV